MAAQLTLEQGSTDKIVEYIEETRRFGLEIAGPDIDKSNLHFGIENEGKTLRFALSAIKGEKTLSELAQLFDVHLFPWRRKPGRGAT